MFFKKSGSPDSYTHTDKHTQRHRHNNSHTNHIHETDNFNNARTRMVPVVDMQYFMLFHLIHIYTYIYTHKCIYIYIYIYVIFLFFYFFIFLFIFFFLLNFNDKNNFPIVIISWMVPINHARNMQFPHCLKQNGNVKNTLVSVSLQYV